ncbi:MAG: hypothetical protein V3T77_07000 [Planctomycetota bacterium]
MLPSLIASALLDPLVLQLFLLTVAKSQLDTRYHSLFAINLLLTVLTCFTAVFMLQAESPGPGWVIMGGVYCLTIGLLTKYCGLSFTRGVLVSTMFWAYKAFVAYMFVELLFILGYNMDIESVKLEALSASEIPKLLQWFMENWLWFQEAQ